MQEFEVARLIVENARDYAIMTLNPQGRITSWNVGAEHILGYPTDEAIGMDFSVLFLEPDRAAQLPARELAKTFEHGRAEDTRWHIRKDGVRFWANGVTMRLETGDGVIKIMRDETQAKFAEDQRVLLLNELNHRIKNTLAVVQSIVEQTLRSSDVDGGVREKLTERLVALSDAHNVLVQQNWAGADLTAIVDQALAPHRALRGDRFHVAGPMVRLSAQQAVSISLALNELTTNAIKYGALSGPRGQVQLSWNLAYMESGARVLTLAWEERGGPAVAPPVRTGFGTRLIQRSFGPENGGRVTFEYPPTGLVCVVEVPLIESEDAEMMRVSGDPSAHPLQGPLERASQSDGASRP